MDNSVKNKHGQQMNEFKEQKPEIRDSVKKSGKQNSDAGFEIEKNENKSKIKCQIKESAQVTDESDSDKEDSTLIKTEETETPIQDLYKQPKTQITGNASSRQFRSETGVFYLNLGHDFSDIGFQAKTKKSKICQIKESAQVTDESDTDNEDLIKIKTEETEEPISPKIPIKTEETEEPISPKILIKTERTEEPIPPKILIMDSRPSRSKKTREYDFDKDEWYDEEPPTRRPLPKPRPSFLEQKTCSGKIIQRTAATRSSTLNRCSSSDNHETHISRMDKIIAQRNIPDVPRRKHHRMSSSGSSVSSSIPYRCSSSDNHETQISGMDEMKHTHRKSSSGIDEMKHSHRMSSSGIDRMNSPGKDRINSSGIDRMRSLGIDRMRSSGIDMPIQRSVFPSIPSIYYTLGSDNNEIQISRMDKIRAQGNIPSIPRRNRPAPPPPDLLE